MTRASDAASGSGSRPDRPEDAREAVERARTHLRNAAREGLEASRALVDAALLASGIGGASNAGLAGEVRSALDDWIAKLEGDLPFSMPRSLAEPLHQALKVEIERWERRSIEDESARPVLRAFIGLRELLWELGIRGDAEPEAATTDAQEPAHRAAGSDRRARPRVQRFDLED